MSEPDRTSAGDSNAAALRLLRAASLPFVVCLLFFFVTPSTERPLRPSSPEISQQVLKVVESQFAAFRDGDYPRAYSFASAEIQHQFTPLTFERMVKDGYPIIAYWHTVAFGVVEDNGHVAVLEVSVKGQRGHPRFFRYLLIREADQWRINGVQELRQSPTQGQFV
ncbi:MAG: DUF4864 domain-containing protein [Proteobacteria bacterium]|nr:DUF4864 domain-containing protein [Pseudomonadota bacterium]